MSPVTENQQNLTLAEIKGLTGKTLLVYWTLLKSGSGMGVREIQRDLDFSSPSLADYHLKKLVDLALVEQTQAGTYIVVRKARIAELRDLIVVRALNRTLTLPRYVFYAVVVTIIWVGYLLIWLFYELPYWGLDIISYGPISFIFANLLGGLGSLFLWYETIRSYRDKPF
ncbi:MAG: winged helix-turn-helix domain-containing protein [Candidatus Hodarchaeales archaeon]|jgi:predicted neutral ceramidase superfamily lipid hydrolase